MQMEVALASCKTFTLPLVPCYLQDCKRSVIARRFYAGMGVGGSWGVQGLPSVGRNAQLSW